MAEAKTIEAPMTIKDYLAERAATMTNVRKEIEDMVQNNIDPKAYVGNLQAKFGLYAINVDGQWQVHDIGDDLATEGNSLWNEVSEAEFGTSFEVKQFIEKSQKLGFAIMKNPYRTDEVKILVIRTTHTFAVKQNYVGLSNAKYDVVI